MPTKLVVSVLGRQTTKKVRSMPNKNDWDPEAEGLGEDACSALAALQYQAFVNSDFCQHF
jgi:hypothetical protein